MKASQLSLDTLKNYAYRIDGEDGYWQDYAINFFVSLVPKKYQDFNLKIIDKLSSFYEIQDAITTFSMFDGIMVIIIKDEAYKLKDGDTALFNTLIDNLDNQYVVFCNANYLTPTMKKKLELIDANRSDLLELRRLIQDSFPEKSIEYAAINLLIEYCSRDMSRISNEIDKLKAYADGKNITVSDVEALVANSIDNEIYEFTGAIADKNNLLAMNILNRFREKGVASSYLISALISQYRRMLHSALSAENDATVAQYLGVKPYAINRYRALSKKYTKKRLKSCLDSLVACEFNFKSGVINENTALNKAISELILV